MKFLEKLIKNKTVIRYLTLLIAIAGLFSYGKLGKLEDPEFKIKEALVITLYPGATPHEVELQVTEKIERALKSIPHVEKYESVSKAGYSEVKVTLSEKLHSREIEQYWDNLRRKVNDAQKNLPLGVLPSIVMDDYGDVYGMFFALTNEGYSTEEFNRYLEYVRREFQNLPGVGRISVYGKQSEAVEVILDREKMAVMKISDKHLQGIFISENLPVDGGKISFGNERLRADISNRFKSVEDIGNQIISSRKNLKGEEEIVLLRDIAQIRRAGKTPVSNLMRYNGRESVGILLSPASGTNVVETGKIIDEKIEEMRKVIPKGIELEKVYYQPELVSSSIKIFVINLIESVIVVVGVLLLTMGMRSGLIIGSGLVLSILGTFPIMKLMGIDVQRVSLGSFIIAMGILVDNSIVVVDEVLNGMKRGEEKFQIIINTIKKTAIPLLGATVIAIAAFLPTVLMETNMGEYISSLFWVIAISLLLSWVFALTSIPVYCEHYLKKDSQNKKINPRVEKFYLWFKDMLQKILNHRKVAVIALLGGMVFSALLFLKIPMSFFPDSDKKGFVVNIWLPEGSRIEKTSEIAKILEKKISGDEKVKDVTVAVGGSPARYYMMTIPEMPNPSFAQLIVSTQDLKSVNRLGKEILEFSRENISDAQIGIRKYSNGVETKYPIEVTVLGPDPQILRDLSEGIMEVMKSTEHPFNIRNNWRRRVPVWKAEYSERKGKLAHISKRDVASGIKRATDGLSLGVFRDGDEALQILLKERALVETDMENIGQLPLWGILDKDGVLLKEVIDSESILWEDSQIWRENGVRAIKIQSDVPIGVGIEDVRKEIRDRVEGIKLPEGYHLKWAGQYAEQVKSSRAVMEYVPLQLLVMFTICVLLFFNLKEPMIIFGMLPLAIIGIAPGLLITGRSFGFMSIIGLVSLTGMMIKNAIILIEEINFEIDTQGKEPYDAILASASNRIRPVTLAAGTTILGMLPLMRDPLYGDMAVTIIFGLTASTILTLMGVPLLYAIVYKIHKKSQ
ncbi:MAG: efflux RND transporter permease subunit [Fusobacteriaceae bacterium]